MELQVAGSLCCLVRLAVPHMDGFLYFRGLTMCRWFSFSSLICPHLSPTHPPTHPPSHPPSFYIYLSATGNASIWKNDTLGKSG